MLGLTQSLQSVAQITAPFLAGLLIQHGQLTSVGARRGGERRDRSDVPFVQSERAAPVMGYRHGYRTTDIAAHPVLQAS